MQICEFFQISTSSSIVISDNAVFNLQIFVFFQLIKIDEVVRGYESPSNKTFEDLCLR